MSVNTQGDYELRYTGNYMDLVSGSGYHLQPIAFHEFLTKNESDFIFIDTFMQIPGYIQDKQEIEMIEEDAREYVVNYIINEFSHNLLGMQDYVRWAKLFENKCASLTPAFWAQVNMHNLMLATDLEMDDSTATRTNAGNAIRLGGQTTTTEQSGESTTTGKTSTSQDITNAQDTDSSTREATATVVNAEDQLTDDIEYDWSSAADSVHEIRTRAGNNKQHMQSVTDNEQKTNSSSSGSSVTSMNNSSDESTNTSTDKMEYTNKMFMQERQWAINTARDLFPLEWLRQQLRPMFYMLY